MSIKRRTQEKNSWIQSLENHSLIQIFLYSLFLFAAVLLTLNGSPVSFCSDLPFHGVIYGISLAVTGIAVLQIGYPYVVKKNSRIILVLGGIVIQLLVLRLVMILSDRGTIAEMNRYLFIPYALFPMLHGIMLGRMLGIYSTVSIALLGTLLVPKDDIMIYLIMSVIASLTAILCTHQLRRRMQLIRAGVLVGLSIVTLALLLGKIDTSHVLGSESLNHIQLIAISCIITVSTALITSMIVNGLLPIFEGAFHLTTDISWLELSDLNHELLKRMQLEAPGTFHHSLIVAALSEAAAETIGANAPMCRVCSYFHDVGKLKKPEYFIENQQDQMENPHDHLTPTMSALIIIAHVKDGIDLAIKHKLNPRIIEVIEEHHGNSLVYYFYRKAQELKKEDLEKVNRQLENLKDLPKLDEKSFRYPGPLPSSKESGIICLADTIESASRSLTKPTPSKISALVEDLIRAKINDGILDDCALSLRELRSIQNSFSKTLNSMMHRRIDFPKNPETNTPSRRDTILEFQEVSDQSVKPSFDTNNKR